MIKVKRTLTEQVENRCFCQLTPCFRKVNMAQEWGNKNESGMSSWASAGTYLTRSEMHGKVSRHGPKAVSYLLMCSVTQPCPIVCNSPMDWHAPGSAVHGIFQARTLECVAISSSRGSSWPKDWTHLSCISCIGSRLFTTMPPGKSSPYERALISVSELLFRNFKSSRLLILETWQLQKGNLIPKAHLLNPAAAACREMAVPGALALPDSRQ